MPTRVDYLCKDWRKLFYRPFLNLSAELSERECCTETIAAPWDSSISLHERRPNPRIWSIFHRGTCRNLFYAFPWPDHAFSLPNTHLSQSFQNRKTQICYRLSVNSRWRSNLAGNRRSSALLAWSPQNLFFSFRVSSYTMLPFCNIRSRPHRRRFSQCKAHLVVLAEI